jgi:aminomethyltransferase
VLRRSPLHSEHERLGARFTPFAGWEMPIQYTGVVSEHLAVRQKAGLFDVSHLGKLIVKGDRPELALDGLFPGKVAGLSEWTAAYNLALDAEGGIVDDIFVYRRPDYLLLVPNAANVAAVRSLIETHDPGLEVEDAAERWAILALQGPESRSIADRLDPALNELELHSFGEFDLGGSKVQAARTGYTGEYGFEFFVEAEKAPAFFKAVLQVGERSGLIPVGLGARDTLRLEMGYALHGNDISVETNPIEASLSWVIDWNKEFKSKGLLEEIRSRGPDRKLVGLTGRGREIPRHGNPVLSGDEAVGEVTSGNFSPVLKKGIALAYVRGDLTQPGTMLGVEVRGRRLEVEVVKPPFVKT